MKPCCEVWIETNEPERELHRFEDLRTAMLVLAMWVSEGAMNGIRNVQIVPNSTCDGHCKITKIVATAE